MARPPRLHFSGALYHVISRGNRKQVLFQDASDYRKYQERLTHYLVRYKCLLYAYVLMPNHVHLLMEVGAVPLSRLMQGLQFTYAQYFNKKYQAVGHLFQGRYKAILCEKEAYLLELARYIHLNPVRAGLVKRPEEYRWSSYPVYLGQREEPAVSTGFILQQFGQKPSTARRAFRRFVMESSGEGHRDDLYDLKIQLCLGSDRFVESLPVKNQVESPRYRIALAEITSTVCRAFQLSPSSLSQRGRGREPAKIRHLIGYLAKDLGGFSYAEVAGSFKREAISFSVGVRRLENRLKQDPPLVAQIKGLREQLTRGKRKIY